MPLTRLKLDKQTYLKSMLRIPSDIPHTPRVHRRKFACTDTLAPFTTTIIIIIIIPTALGHS